MRQTTLYLDPATATLNGSLAPGWLRLDGRFTVGSGLGTLQLALLVDIIAEASGDTGWVVAQAFAELADV